MMPMFFYPPSCHCHACSGDLKRLGSASPGRAHVSSSGSGTAGQGRDESGPMGQALVEQGHQG